MVKVLVVLLLVANIVAAAWISQRTPNDILREPGRMNAQIAADQFRLLTDADLAHLQKAEEAAKAQAAAAAQAAVPPAAPAATTPAPPPTAAPAPPAASAGGAAGR
ncbi:putative uncharacterized protein [Burkholderiales bacterium GJ-E10]|nr:putative uncharacterized protein [Burkholderiales bacterium GJ-E10]